MARPAAAAAVDGFLNFRKPVGITSMEALRRVKRITGQRKKVGHAGTIDPLAEGVLPICFGQGTRLMEQVVTGRKRYRMTMRLGAESATYDAEGDITEFPDAHPVSQGELDDALAGFIGRIEQVPPMYSAIKINGQRLYELARKGHDVARPARPVDVHAIRVDDFAWPNLTLTVDCGRGTYLRSIAHDLGQKLGCGGYVTGLIRLSCGQFTIADSVGLPELEQAAAESGWERLLHPVDWALRDCPALTLTPAEASAVRNGQAIAGGGYAGFDEYDGYGGYSGHDEYAGQGQPGQWRAYSEDGAFLALLRYEPEGARWQPTRVFRGDKPSPYAPTQEPGGQSAGSRNR